MEEKIEKLRDVVAIQKLDGNWNYSNGMLGLANGLILALSIMEGNDPEYLEKPEEWLEDKEE